MKKTGIFLGGFATGVVVTFVILLIIGLAQNSSAITGVTNFEEPGEIISGKSFEVFQVIAENAALVDEDMKELTSNVGVVMVKDNQFKIGVNCRIPLNEHIQVVEEKVNEKTKEFGYSYKVLGARNRHYVDPNGKLVQTLLNVYQEVTGDYENKPFTIGGGTYAREIGNAVAYGPVFVGREDVCHIADEYMILEDFYKAIEVYVKAIYELSK